MLHTVLLVGFTAAYKLNRCRNRKTDCSKNRFLLVRCDATPSVCHSPAYHRDCSSSGNRVGRLSDLLLQLSRRRVSQGSRDPVCRIWRRAVRRVSFLCLSTARVAGLRACFYLAACLVVDHSTATRSRLGAGIRETASRRRQRRSRDDPQHPKLRLPKRNRLYAALLQQDL